MKTVTFRGFLSALSLVWLVAGPAFGQAPEPPRSGPANIATACLLPQPQPLGIGEFSPSAPTTPLPADELARLRAAKKARINAKEKLAKSFSDMQAEQKGDKAVFDVAVWGIKKTTAASPVLGETLGVLLDQTREYFVEQMDSSRRDLVNAGLLGYLKNGGSIEGLDTIARMNIPLNDKVARFRAEMESKNQSISSELFDAMRKDQPEVVDRIMQKYLLNAVTEGFTATIASNGVTQEMLKWNSQVLQAHTVESTRQFNVLLKGQKDFAVETRKNFADLADSQKKLHQEVGELKKTVEKTEGKVTLMQDHMFDEMTPDEQISAIEKGWFKDRPNEAEERLARAKVNQRAQAFDTNIQRSIKGAEDFLAIMDNLGVNPERTKGLRTAVKGANECYGMIKSLAKVPPDYLAGIRCMTNLLGLGSPNPEDVRHQEIMGSLGRIEEGLKDLDGKLNTIIKLQCDTLAAIGEVAKMVTAAHEQEMAISLDILRTTIHLKKLSDEVLRRQAGYKRCEELSAALRLDSVNMVIPTYENLTASVSTQFASTYAPIFQLFNAPLFGEAPDGSTVANAYFYLDTWLDPRDAATPDAGKVHFNWRSLKRIAIDGDITAKKLVFARLTRPMPTISLLQSRDDVVVGDKIDNSVFDVFSGELLWPAAVLQHCRHAANGHVLWSWVDWNGGRVLSRDDMLRPAQRSFARANGLRILGEAERLAVASLAQQTLLSGDTLLAPGQATIEKEITRLSAPANDSTPAQDFVELSGLMAANPDVVGTNVLTYFIRSTFDKGATAEGVGVADGKLAAYAVALRQSDAEVLKQVLPLPFERRWVTPAPEPAPAPIQSPRWCVVLKSSGVEVLIPLPAAEVVRAGSLSANPEAPLLLEALRDIRDQINTYRAMDTLSDAQLLSLVGAN